MALAYVARFATSTGKLEAYLARKLRERGWESAGIEAQDEAALTEGRAAVAEAIGRFVRLGYVDDAGYARMRAGSLGRRGIGGRRIAEDLNAAGIAEDIREEVRPSEWAARQAALTCATKRGLGAFARRPANLDSVDADGDMSEALSALRQKQMATMLRAGHSMDHVRAILAAPDADAAQAWVDEARDSDDTA